MKLQSKASLSSKGSSLTSSHASSRSSSSHHKHKSKHPKSPGQGGNKPTNPPVHGPPPLIRHQHQRDTVPHPPAPTTPDYHPPPVHRDPSEYRPPPIPPRGSAGFGSSPNLGSIDMMRQRREERKADRFMDEQPPSYDIIKRSPLWRKAEDHLAAVAVQGWN